MNKQCPYFNASNADINTFYYICGKDFSPVPPSTKNSMDNNKSLNTRLGYFKGRTHLTNNMPFDLEITSESLILHFP